MSEIPNEKIPTVIELIEKLKKGELGDELVFKYQSTSGVHLIHRDELQKELALSQIYSGNHRDRLIGTKTRQ